MGSLEPDSDPSNNTENGRDDRGCCPVPTRVDLAISIQQPPATASVGDTLTFNITVTNTGSELAPRAVAVLGVPPNTSFVSLTPSRGTCTGTTILFCQIGDLGPNESVTFTLRVTVVSPGTISLRGVTLGARLETTYANNRATVQLNVAGPPLPGPLPSPGASPSPIALPTPTLIPHPSDSDDKDEERARERREREAEARQEQEEEETQGNVLAVRCGPPGLASRARLIAGRRRADRGGRRRRRRAVRHHRHDRRQPEGAAARGWGTEGLPEHPGRGLSGGEREEGPRAAVRRR